MKGKKTTKKTDEMPQSLYGFSVGDKVEVLDPGLAMLRSLMGGKPNHHGTVSGFLGGDILVEFPLSGKDHSQVSPYPPDMVRKRQ